MDREEQITLAARLRDEGWGVEPPEQHLLDIPDEFREIWRSVEEFTMTSIERAYALYEAVRYVCDSGIEGSFVECGVWRGGSCMLMAQTILRRGISPRPVYLYDTFSGMTEPTDEDVIAWNGRSVRERFERFDSWAVGLDEVKANLLTTGYPSEMFHFVRGDVLDTLESIRPESIALLRLDTDWYRSTLRELEVLYPRLRRGGILLLDDYGHFRGAKQAVDEFFRKREKPYFARVDYTGRVGVKTD